MLSGSDGLTAIAVSLWGPSGPQLRFTFGSAVAATLQITDPFLRAGPADQTAPAIGASARLLWTKSIGRLRSPPSSSAMTGDAASATDTSETDTMSACRQRRWRVAGIQCLLESSERRPADGAGRLDWSA